MLLYNYLDYYLTTRDPITPIQRELIAPVSVNRSMSGVGYTYIKTPQRYHFSYTIDILTHAERDELFNFFNLVIGNKFVLTDYDLDTWLVEFVQNKLNLVERRTSWQVLIELEGVANA